MRFAVPEIETIEIQARGLRFPALSCGRGPLVVLQHGFPDLPDTFGDQMLALASAGYRAVAPTLRGYHRLCLPETSEVHIEAAADDLIAFVDALGEERASLVGHDWGAVATYLAVARAPERFICAVAGAIPYLAGLPEALLRVPRQLARSWYQAYFALPWLPEMWFAGESRRVVDWAWRTWSPTAQAPAVHLERVARRLDDRAIRSAALQYYRALLRPGRRQLEAWQLARRPLQVPLLCLYGERDGCMDGRLNGPAGLRAEQAPLTVEGFADAGHFLHIDQPTRFNARLLGWLSAHQASS